jgi:NAD(P) transhydrogenase subunit beta
VSLLVTDYLYVLSIFFFVLSLKLMSEVSTSRGGNWSAAAGLLVAIVGTVIAYQAQRVDLLLVSVVLGTVVGLPIGLKVSMVAVPQRTAISQSFGSLAVALTGTAEYYQDMHTMDTFTIAVLVAEMILGFLTFSGSVIAFSKLQELIPGRPFIYKGRNVVSIALLCASGALGVYLVANPSQSMVLPIMDGLALLFGLLLVLGIGGGDMPTVIALLNSFTGMSAAALGFALDNKVLIVAGSLDGSSGLILSIIMSQAMNRSFLNVLFGGVGTAAAAGTGGAQQEQRTIVSYTPEDVATVLKTARKVVMVPGYGMAVAQAQHVVKELGDILQKSGVDVKYAIHPVAGRMPGHMNVLLAEAQVPYDQLWEMDKINPLFPETDVAIVVGANDVTNPAARTNTSSPLYGMPILDVDKAKTVVFIKRTAGPGFAGVDNELFYLPNTMMVFGDAKKVLSELVALLRK